MRKIIFALFTAVALALSLSVGVASARDGDDFTCTNANGAPVTCTFGNGHPIPSSVPPCTILTGATTCTGELGGLLGHGHPGGFPGGNGLPGPGWIYPGVPQGFPTLINGNLLNLQALGLIGVGVGNVNVCTFPSWNQFDGQFSGQFGTRWDTVRSHFGHNPNSQWLALRQAARCGGAFPVPGTGFPTLIDGSLLNLGAYGATNADPVSVCNFATWDNFSNQWGPRFGGRFDSFRGRFGGNVGAWRSGWVRLRSQARCSNTTVIQNNPAPAPTIINNNNTTTVAPSSVSSDPAPRSYPAPSASAPMDSPTLVIPRGSVATGGCDVAYVAAHGLEG